jgi:hypothetical protein
MHKYKSTLAGCTENAQVQEHTGTLHRKRTSTRAHWQAAQKTHKYKSTQAGSTENAQVQEHTGSTENAQVRARFVLGRFSDELVCPQAIPP